MTSITTRNILDDKEGIANEWVEERDKESIPSVADIYRSAKYPLTPTSEIKMGKTGLPIN